MKTRNLFRFYVFMTGFLLFDNTLIADGSSTTYQPVEFHLKKNVQASGLCLKVSDLGRFSYLKTTPEWLKTETQEKSESCLYLYPDYGSMITAESIELKLLQQGMYPQIKGADHIRVNLKKIKISRETINQMLQKKYNNPGFDYSGEDIEVIDRVNVDFSLAHTKIKKSQSNTLFVTLNDLRDKKIPSYSFSKSFFAELDMKKSQVNVISDHNINRTEPVMNNQEKTGFADYFEPVSGAVKKGEVLTAYLIEGGIKFSTQVKTMQAAKKGDTVRARLLRNGRLTSIRIIDTETAVFIER